MPENDQKIIDPTVNVSELVERSIVRLDDLRRIEVKRLDDKIEAADVKYQVQFTSSKEAAAQRFEAQQLALKDALIAQEKAVAAALEGTKEAINKADVATDKRFGLLSEKIDAVIETTSKNTGAQGIYVTHSDLNIAMEKLQSSIEVTLRPVVNYMNSSQGKSKGLNAGWIYFLGCVSLISTLLSIFVVLSK